MKSLTVGKLRQQTALLDADTPVVLMVSGVFEHTSASLLTISDCYESPTMPDGTEKRCLKIVLIPKRIAESL